MKTRICILIIFLILLNACKEKQIEKITLPEIDISNAPNGIVNLPENIPDVIKKTFVKYTKYIAPNGKPIHFLAQDAWTDNQINHAKNVLQHILTSYPGSIYGNDKTAIANSMSDKRATMVLFNDTDELSKAFSNGLENMDLSMQDLRSNESPAVGDKDYMNHITRDASYEEIWHLVHDYGIVPTLPKMIAEMRIANDEAAEKGWIAWPRDESENHPNEYVGVLIDNYYDLWITQPKLYEARKYKSGPEGSTHFGNYFANGRFNLQQKDIKGYTLMEKFFQPYLTYTPVLPEDFTGTFSIALDKSKAYTYKSRYLVNVTLTGSNNAHLIGNAHKNKFTGNMGNNSFTGAGNDDEIDGNEGEDTAVFSGNSDEYVISSENRITTVSDKNSGRDGVDTLKNIEFLQFSDKKIQLTNKK